MPKRQRKPTSKRSSRKTLEPALKLSEADIERTCTDYLILDGWRALKTDPVSDRSRSKGFGEPGMADYLYFRYGLAAKITHNWPEDPIAWRVMTEVVWIEWKSRRGRMKSHQALWHEVERDRGACTARAGVDFEASIDGFLAWYRASGLNRRL